MANMIPDKEQWVSARKRDVIDMLPYKLQRAELFFTAVPKQAVCGQQGGKRRLSKVKTLERIRKKSFDYLKLEVFY